jgi:hypothetical protein
MYLRIDNVKKIILSTILISTLAFAENPFNKYLGTEVELYGAFIISSKKGTRASIVAGAMFKGVAAKYDKARNNKNLNLLINTVHDIQKNKTLLVIANKWNGKKIIAKVLETNSEWIKSVYGDKDMIDNNVKLKIIFLGEDISKTPIIGWVDVDLEDIKILK